MVIIHFTVDYIAHSWISFKFYSGKNVGERFYFSTWIRTKDQGPVRRIILFFSQSHKLNVIMQTNNLHVLFMVPFSPAYICHFEECWMVLMLLKWQRERKAQPYRGSNLQGALCGSTLFLSDISSYAYSLLFFPK